MTAVPRHLYIYIQPAFLEPAVCRQLCTEMQTGPREAAEVLPDGGSAAGGRRAEYAEVSAAAVSLLETRLDAEREAIAAFLGRRVAEREGPGFVCYEPGGFYGPHRDRLAGDAWPDARRRAIAAVVFLNTAAAGGMAGDFTGGTLRLFVDTAEPVAVTPVQGTLVAFSADVVHEVTPVGQGVRFSIVDWFYEPVS